MIFKCCFDFRNIKKQNGSINLKNVDYDTILKEIEHLQLFVNLIFPVNVIQPFRNRLMEIENFPRDVPVGIY